MAQDTDKERPLGAAVVPAPEFSDKWECHLFGSMGAFVYTPLKGKEPNFFWRWMQYLLIGNRWVRK